MDKNRVLIFGGSLIVCLIIGAAVVILLSPQQDCPDCNQHIFSDCNYVNIIYDCPPDYNAIIQVQCSKYTPPFYPANQDVNFITQAYPNAVCERDQQDLIICQDCTEMNEIGYYCIMQQYLET